MAHYLTQLASNDELMDFFQTEEGLSLQHFLLGVFFYCDMGEMKLFCPLSKHKKGIMFIRQIKESHYCCFVLLYRFDCNVLTVYSDCTPSLLLEGQ